MKVILLQDVAKIGRRFEVVEVPHGYAMNKLIPQQLAKEATPENLKQVESRAAKAVTERAAADAAFSSAVALLETTAITVPAEANESGHLFEALKRERVAEALKAEGVTLTPDQIKIDEPIKSVGEHTLTAVSNGTEKKFTITVTAK